MISFWISVVLPKMDRALNNLGRLLVTTVKAAARDSGMLSSDLLAAGGCSCPGLCWAGLPRSGSWLAVRASRARRRTVPLDR
jgi:hypothetical protein